MLASISEKPFVKEGWIYEIKWDGYRAISYINNGKVSMRSRNEKSFDAKFYPLHDELSKWKVNAIIDGEIVAVNEQGFPDFEKLQMWRSEADGNLVYFIFDLLWYEGKDLTQIPLIQRKKLLEQIIPTGSSFIKASESIDASGKEIFELARKMNLEGIIAKKADSLYKPGTRNKEWQKIKTEKTMEATIVGYTKNEGTRKKFSSLIMGIYHDDELIPLSPVGTGFTTAMQSEIMEKIKPLITKKCPLDIVPDLNKGSRFRSQSIRSEVVWIKPGIVVEISFRTVSPDGAVRHPSFKRLRDDKSIRDLKKEQDADIIPAKQNDPKLLKEITKGRSGKERKTLLNPSEKSQSRDINHHLLKFTNLDKIFWPSMNISKRDLINYYYQVAPFILPYLKDRPQTLNRFPNGVEGKSFYQKDVKGKVPSWIDRFEYYSERDQRLKEFLVCNDEASLLYTVNLGCIEINPWSSRKSTPDNPDWCIIDLDPDRNSFDDVILAAKTTHEVLTQIGVQSYCKTSGSTGLHIYIPLGSKYSYEDSKEFGRALVKVIHKIIPDFTSIERLTSKRKGKLYLDFLQNRPQATVAAPYSLRPKKIPSVSMPVHWDEVKPGLSINDFTLQNAIARLKEYGDIFKPVLGKGIKMNDALKKLGNLF